MSKNITTARQTKVAVSMEHSGPLPDAVTYARYEATTPGAGERILAMAEREQAHRHKMEELVNRALVEDATAERKEIKRGQWLAFFIALVILAIGGWLAYTNHPLVGGLLTAGTLVGIVSAFLGRSRQKAAEKPEPHLPSKK